MWDRRKFVADHIVEKQAFWLGARKQGFQDNIYIIPGCNLRDVERIQPIYFRIVDRNAPFAAFSRPYIKVYLR